MKRLTIAELTERAARGVGKVHRDGLRGASQVSMDEVEAMALLLAALGVTPIDPGSYTPPNKIPYSEGARA